jgi:hypothetical protein
MRVLLTNTTLAHYAGSELYLRDLAGVLVRRGHSPVAFSQVLGPVAEELRAASVPVIDDLNDLTAAPDVIHGHHHLETMAALLRFPGVPAVFVCHGWVPWEESPPWHPRIRHYVAVSELLAERLTSSAVPSERVEVLPNAVDLSRFRARRDLPPVPSRALVFDNYATEDTYVPLVRRVCERLGLSLDVVGLGVNRETRTPESLLPDYDLVFASGRGALEALAVGCAVVVCNATALAGLVTTKDLHRMRRLNFGFRLMQGPLTGDDLRREIERYDASEAAAVSEAVRAAAGLDALADRFESIYRDAVEDQRADPPGLLQESHAETRYLQWLKRFVYEHEATTERYEWAEADRHRLFAERVDMEDQRDALASERDALGAERDALGAERDALRAEHDGLATELDQLRAERDRLAERLDVLRAERDSLGAALSAMEATTTWRARGRIVSAPRVVRAPAVFAGRVSRALSRALGRPD